MKKVCIILVSIMIAVAALYTGMAWWSGMMVEKEFYRLLKGTQNRGYVSLTTSDYHRGIFRSEALTTAEFHIRGADNQDTALVIDLRHDIAHGPWPVESSLSELSLLRPVLAIIDTKILSSLQPQGTFDNIFTELFTRLSIQDRTIFYLRGNGASHLTVSPFRGTFGKDKLSVDLRKTTLDTSFSAEFDTLTSTLTFPGLEARGNTGRIMIKDTVLDMDMHRVVVDFYLGNSSFTTALLEVEGTAQEEAHSFSMKNLTMTSSNTESNTLFNSAVRVSFDEILTDGTRIGPAKLTMAVRNLDTASMVLLQSSLCEIQNNQKQEQAENVDRMIMSTCMEVLPRMLKESPELEITQLSFSTTEGDALVKALVSFDGSQMGPAFNATLLAGALSAQAEFSTTERLLQRFFEFKHTHRIENEIKTGTRSKLNDKKLQTLAARHGRHELDRLIKQHILIRNDTNITASASYRQGQVILNGRPLLLQDLLRQNAM